MSLEIVEVYAGLSDHHVVVRRLAVTKPTPPTRLVTSRDTRAVCSSDFQANVKAMVDSAG